MKFVYFSHVSVKLRLQDHNFIQHISVLGFNDLLNLLFILILQTLFHYPFVFIPFLWLLRLLYSNFELFLQLGVFDLQLFNQCLRTTLVTIQLFYMIQLSLSHLLLNLLFVTLDQLQLPTNGISFFTHFLQLQLQLLYLNLNHKIITCFSLRWLYICSCFYFSIYFLKYCN